MIEWHKKFSERWQARLKLSNYCMLWLVFFEGVFFAPLIVWLVNC